MTILFGFNLIHVPFCASLLLMVRGGEEAAMMHLPQLLRLTAKNVILPILALYWEGSRRFDTGDL